MSKNKEKARSTWEEIKSTGMTAMIDVTFLLLIFFMLAAKFKTAEGQMNAYLPKEGFNRGPAEDEEKIRILLRWCKPSGYKTSSDPRWGRPVLKGGNPVVGFQLFERQGRPDFSEMIRFIHRQKKNWGTQKEMEVIIDSDPLVSWNWVIQTVDSLVGAGLKKVSFAPREK